MRGKEIGHLIKVRLVGITPAYAGKSCSYNSRTTASGDHPRMCGEKVSMVFSWFAPLGSPPHVRGKARLRRGPRITPGITPACAGKSTPTVGLCCQCRDHPRMCGEKPSGLAPAGWPSGSPPHVRGKGCRYFLATSAARITPAHAGKRRSARNLTFRLRDHPRMCGEKHDCSQRVIAHLGSPPRMRGKVQA